MRELLLIVRDILLLRRGPQDLPYSPRLCVLAVGAAAAIEVVLSTLLGKSPADTMIRALVTAAIPLGLLYLVLNLRQATARFAQTALASVACGIVILLLSVPLLLMMTDGMPATPEQLTPRHTFIGLCSLLILSWKLVVDGHILRHALDSPFFVGLIVGILLLAAELVLASALLGKPTGA